MRFVLIFVVAVTYAQSVWAKEDSVPLIMPQWQLQTQEGDIVSAKDFAGKPLVLHFWATWCPYCKKLQPELDRLAQKYSSDGLQVIGVSLLEPDGARPQTELESRGVRFRTVVDGESLGIDVFNIQGTPTTVFIAPSGKVLGKTMQSDPTDPQWEQTIRYLIQLPR